MKEICINCKRKNNWIGCFECDGEFYEPKTKEIRKKILPKYFKEVKTGIKDFEIRKDDSDYEVGDTLILQEVENKLHKSALGEFFIAHYTGNEITKRIKYKITHEEFPQGIQEGYCILGLEDIEENIKGRIKALVRTDGFNIFDDEGFICGTLGVNKEKLKGLLHKVNDSIQLKNIDLTGISEAAQWNKMCEEEEEFSEAYFQYRNGKTEENKNHVIEELYDEFQAKLGLLEKQGITAEEVQAYYPKHLKKLENRPRCKEE